MASLLTFPIAFLVIIGIAVLITIESRRARRLKGLPPATGFGGWLIVLAIHQTLWLLGQLRELFVAVGGLPGVDAKIAVGLLLIYVLTILFALVAMFRRRRYFKYAYLTQSACTLAICGLSALATSWRPEDFSRLAYRHGQIMGGALVAIAWTIYIFRSERVKSTFVRPEAVTKGVVEVF